MTRKCKCGGTLVKIVDRVTFFTVRCISCKARYTQHKRLPADYEALRTMRLKARFDELRATSLAR